MARPKAKMEKRLAKRDGWEGYYTARTVSTAALLISTGVCLRGLIGWWGFLPLWVLQVEFICRLFDTGLLGSVQKVAPIMETLKSADGAYSWEEVAAHNSRESAWIAIEGFVYDVTHFIDHHPGGRELILLGVGREATDLFKSYHPFSERPGKTLQKYRIGTLTSYEHPIYKADSGFYREAAAAVKKYFDDTGLDRKNPLTGFIRMLPVYVVFFLTFYFAFCKEGLSMPLRIALGIVMGMCQGMPLTGWMHDASHAAIGSCERWWWGIGRFALDYVSGSSMVSWRNQHVMGHHVYTNVLGSDPDLPVLLNGDPRRLVDQQVWKSMYRFQHIYLPPLYGILGLKSRLQDLTEVFWNRTNGPIRVNPISTEDYLRMLCGKFVWAFYRFVVPWVFCRALSPRQLIALFFVTEFTTGYWLAFNFQVSHISDDAEFLFSDAKKRAEGKCPGTFDDEWAVSQITTTIDYGHGSPLAAYFSGALNYQTVHHLFPTVSQYHYPAITPIVMKVAEKHGLRFNVKKNFLEAFYSHLKHLRDMGEQGKAAELKLE